MFEFCGGVAQWCRGVFKDSALDPGSSKGVALDGVRATARGVGGAPVGRCVVGMAQAEILCYGEGAW